MEPRRSWPPGERRRAGLRPPGGRGGREPGGGPGAGREFRGGPPWRKTMASKQKITINQPQAIPLDRLRISDANVRRVKPGESVAEMADSITRRGLVHNLNVRPILASEGHATSRKTAAKGKREETPSEHRGGL